MVLENSWAIKQLKFLQPPLRRVSNAFALCTYFTRKNDEVAIERSLTQRWGPIERIVKVHELMTVAVSWFT